MAIIQSGRDHDVQGSSDRTLVMPAMTLIDRAIAMAAESTPQIRGFVEESGQSVQALLRAESPTARTVRSNGEVYFRPPSISPYCETYHRGRHQVISFQPSDLIDGIDGVMLLSFTVGPYRSNSPYRPTRTDLLMADVDYVAAYTFVNGEVGALMAVRECSGCALIREGRGITQELYTQGNPCRYILSDIERYRGDGRVRINEPVFPGY